MSLDDVVSISSEGFRRDLRSKLVPTAPANGSWLASVHPCTRHTECLASSSAPAFSNKCLDMAIYISSPNHQGFALQGQTRSIQISNILITDIFVPINCLRILCVQRLPIVVKVAGQPTSTAIEAKASKSDILTRETKQQAFASPSREANIVLGAWLQTAEEWGIDIPANSCAAANAVSKITSWNRGCAVQI
eukprot:SAG31_NODE_772_length_12197_cov_7.075963_12_plen_192_part_00